MKRILFFAIAIVVCGTLGAEAQQELDVPHLFNDKVTGAFEKQGPSTLAFLKVTPSARIAAMGDAYTSVAEGMDAIYLNPAGITSVRRLGYSFGYVQWLVDSRFYSGAVALNVGWNAVLGISVVNHQPPEIERTTILEPNGTGEMLDVGDYALGVIFARQLTDKLSAAAKFSFVQSNLGPEKLGGTSLSLYTLLHTGYRSLRIGMGINNLGNEMKIHSDPAEFPVVFNLGTSMEVVGELGDPMSLTASFEGAYFTDRDQRYNLGGELWLKNIVALRAGYKFDYDAESWTVGAGLKGTFSGRNIRLDIAYSNFGKYFDAPIRLSFSGSL